MKLIIYLVLAFYLSSTFSSGINAQPKNENSNIIARINENYTVTFDDLKKYVKDWMFDKKYPNKTDAYLNALDALLINQMKRFDFFERGLDRDKKLIQNVQRVINEELTIKYFEKYFMGKYTSEANMLDAYNKMGKEVVSRQIVLYKKENATPKQIDSLKRKTLQIKSDVDKGKKFENLVAKYSQETTSKNSKGYTSPVTWEQSLADPVFNTIFSLKPGDVRIIETNDSFVIVNVTSINKLSVEPFEEIKGTVEQKLRSGYFDTALKEFDDFKKTFVDESSIVWNEKSIKKIVEWSQNSKFYSQLYETTITQEILQNGNDTILTYSNNVVDLKEFLRLLDEILILNSSERTNEKNIKEFLLESIMLDYVVKKANENNFLRDIFNPFTNNSVIKNRLVWMYNKAVIESRIEDTTSVVLQKFYDAQKDSLYYQLDKVNIYALIFPNKSDADSAANKIRSGTPFEKIMDRWFVKTYIINREGNYNSFLSKEKPYLAEEAFKLQLGEIAGPVEFEDDIKGKQYAIIKCVGRQNQKQLTYSDVKNKIGNDYRTYYYEKFSKENEIMLKSKFNLEINEAVLNNLISTDK